MSTHASFRRLFLALLALLTIALPLKAGTMLSPVQVLGTDLGTFESRHRW